MNSNGPGLVSFTSAAMTNQTGKPQINAVSAQTTSRTRFTSAYNGWSDASLRRMSGRPEKLVTSRAVTAALNDPDTMYKEISRSSQKFSRWTHDSLSHSIAAAESRGDARTSVSKLCCRWSRSISSTWPSTARLSSPPDSASDTNPTTCIEGASRLSVSANSYALAFDPTMTTRPETSPRAATYASIRANTARTPATAAVASTAPTR